VSTSIVRWELMLTAGAALLNSQPKDPAHVYPITPQYYLSEMAIDEDTDITVSREDFLSALRELVPSVSQTEMEHYRLVQQRFADNSQPAEQEVKEDVDVGEVTVAPLVDRKGKGRVV